MVMIPKAEQFKWRFIAILVTPYRVWAREAGIAVSRWMNSLKRDWIANDPKKSSEDSVYEISLLTEANSGEYGAVNVLMMDDLEKGFEKVLHTNLRKKGSCLLVSQYEVKLVSGDVH